MSNTVYHELPPIYDENSKILILGSIPSVKSREYGFYYSHPQNRFFKVLSIIFNKSIENNNESKKKFLIENNIALWDVIKSCQINNSDDSSIKNVEVNDINLIINNSKINKIFTTGKKAYNLYTKYCYPKTKIEAIYLPSTSSANATMSIDKLIQEYSIILKSLN